MEGDHERCFCGHFRSEHEGLERCHGAYGTLTSEADDDSVEVLCHCVRFDAVEPYYHEVRT